MMAVSRTAILPAMSMVPTVSAVWRTAEWHEREAYDLVGMIFDEHPDLVILEVRVPVMDGRDVLRVLKTTQATRELPIVVLTEIDDDEEGWQLKDMGASAFLTKPAQHDMLELLVEKFVL